MKETKNSQQDSKCVLFLFFFCADVRDRKCRAASFANQLFLFVNRTKILHVFQILTVVPSFLTQHSTCLYLYKLLQSIQSFIVYCYCVSRDCKLMFADMFHHFDTNTQEIITIHTRVKFNYQNKS